MAMVGAQVLMPGGRLRCTIRGMAAQSFPVCSLAHLRRLANSLSVPGPNPLHGFRPAAWRAVQAGLIGTLAGLLVGMVTSCTTDGGGGGNTTIIAAPNGLVMYLAPTNTGGAIQGAGQVSSLTVIGEPIAPGVFSSGGTLVNRSGLYPADLQPGPQPALPSSPQ